MFATTTKSAHQSNNPKARSAETRGVWAEMKHKWFFGLVIVSALAFLAWLPARANSTGGKQEPPERVVSGFYEWYLQYIDHGGDMRNPLVDSAYRERSELAPAFVSQVDESLATADKGAYDPILLAQDIPERIVVSTATISGDTAQVGVTMFWSGNPTPSERTVTLSLANGRWVMTGIRF
jgi:hypothetical protein